MTQFSFRQTDQKTSTKSPLVIGWYVCEHSHTVIDAIRQCLLWCITACLLVSLSKKN